MKIALIVRRLNGKGGVQRQALSLVQPFQKAGHTVTLYTFNYVREDCYPELIGDTPVIELPKSLHLSTGGFFGFINETRMAYRFAPYIKKETDVLHPHDTVAHQVAYFFKKRFKNIPSIWNMNELTAMRWPPELLSLVEDPKFHDIPWRPLWLKKFFIYFRNAYDTFFVRKQDIITVFDTYHKNLLKRFSGREATIVPSGLDVLRFTFTPKIPPKKGERLKLLSSGIFLSYRRFEDILRALPELIKDGYNPELTIFGDTSTDKKYLEKLQELALHLGIDSRITFFGKYTDEELVQYFKNSHIFIFPHLQSQGLSVYESIASGLPTIIAPMEGTYETINDGFHALLVPIRDPKGIANAVKRLVDDPLLYQKLSREGSEEIRNTFSWERYGKDILEVIQRQKS